MTHSEIIRQLISSKANESDFHDFKEQWHVKNKDLIHDILCFANSLSKKQYRYIIIGVDDTDFSIKSVDTQPENRKTQANLLDLLHNANLNVIPIITLETIHYEHSFLLDVIIIEETNFRPYYLTKDYSKQKSKNPLRAGVIYSRSGDRNTPINHTVDSTSMEKLWRIRFGLDKTPLERALIYLNQPEKWERQNIKGMTLQANDSSGQEWISQDYEQYYYKDFPEFTVNLIYDINRGSSFNEPNITAKFPDRSPGSWYDCQLRYHQTILVNEPFITADGHNYIVGLPEIRNDRTYYYVRNSHRYIMSIFVDQHRKHMGHHNFHTFIQRIKAKIVDEQPVESVDSF
tara:strand:+ start:35225 stop:36259 length:1035 start_codon:yes stop_codon:yes gene_type:complete